MKETQLEAILQGVPLSLATLYHHVELLMQRQTFTYFRALRMCVVLYLFAISALPLTAQDVDNSTTYTSEGTIIPIQQPHGAHMLPVLDALLSDELSLLNNTQYVEATQQPSFLDDVRFAYASNDIPTTNSIRSDCGFELDNSISALELGVEGLRRNLPLTRSVADTNTKVSQLRYVYNNRYQLKLTISLTEDQTVDIGLYNILGKRIKDLEHSFMPECEDKELKYSISDVPPGVYIVAAQGSNFRSALRVAISRGDE